MKLSRIIHVLNVVVGFAGVITAIVAVAGPDGVVRGLTREHLLLCSGLLILVAIWLAVNTVHHVMLENKGDVI